MTIILLILDFCGVLWLPWWVYLIGFLIESELAQRRENERRT